MNVTIEMGHRRGRGGRLARAAREVARIGAVGCVVTAVWMVNDVAGVLAAGFGLWAWSSWLD